MAYHSDPVRLACAACQRNRGPFRPRQRHTEKLRQRGGNGAHIYWQNPGDSGYPPRFSWQLPTGASITAPEHPAPSRLTLGGIAMNVHVGRTVLLARLHVPAGLVPGTVLPVSGTVDLLVCSTEACVPQTVRLASTLPIGAGTPYAAAQRLIDSARAAMPLPVSATAPFTLDGLTLHLRLPLAPPAGGETMALFPADPLMAGAACATCHCRHPRAWCFKAGCRVGWGGAGRVTTEPHALRVPDPQPQGDGVGPFRSGGR